MMGLFSKSPEEKAAKLIKKGDNCFDSKNYMEAIMWYDKALELDPKNEFTWSSKADCFRELKLYEEAIIWYNKALELDPNDENTWYFKARCFEELKLYEEAIEAMNEAKNINPTYAVFWHKLGDYYNFSGSYEEALAYYDESLKHATKEIEIEMTNTMKSFVYKKLNKNKLICPNCNAEYEEGTNFCNVCGNKLIKKE